MSREARRIFARRRRVDAGDAALAAGRTVEPVDGAEGYIPVARGVRLWYRIVGDGPATVVVPCTGNHTELERLAGPGRRVLFYDVRSRGRSSAVEDPTIAGFSVEVTDLEAVRQTFGIERFTGLGTSYQAGVLATYALQHPERVERLVLAAAIPPWAGAPTRKGREPAPADLARLDQLDASGLRGSDPAAYCRAWREVYLPLQMGRPAGFVNLADVCDLPNEQPAHALRATVFVFAQLGVYDWRPHLRDLTVPVLVVHGTEDQDPIETAGEWVAALPDARLLALDGVGRFPWAEVPDEFFGPVDRFLAGERI